MLLRERVSCLRSAPERFVGEKANEVERMKYESLKLNWKLQKVNVKAQKIKKEKVSAHVGR